MDSVHKDLVNAVVDGVATQLQKKPLPVTPEYFDVRGAAQFTSFTEKALRDKITLGIGPKTIKIGRCIRIKREDLVAWVEQGVQ